MIMIRIPALVCSLANASTNDNDSHYGARLSSANGSTNTNESDSYSAPMLTECYLSVTQHPV